MIDLGHFGRFGDGLRALVVDILLAGVRLFARSLPLLSPLLLRLSLCGRINLARGDRDALRDLVLLAASRQLALRKFLDDERRGRFPYSRRRALERGGDRPELGEGTVDASSSVSFERPAEEHQPTGTVAHACVVRCQSSLCVTAVEAVRGRQLPPNPPRPS